MDAKNALYFNSFAFVVFFAVVFTVYWALPRIQERMPWRNRIDPHRGRMFWLLLASCIFYMSFNPWFILLILFSASVDYLVALRLEVTKAVVWRRCLLVFSICTNLGLLAFFKYTAFILDSLCSVCGWVGLPMMNPIPGSGTDAGRASPLILFGLNPESPVVKFGLPLGISFYTFETISYIVDVYLGRLKAVRNLMDYAMYIMFFPHLLAGPIVRPRDFLPQVQQKKHFDWDRLQLGAQYFLVGLFKKAVIADQLAVVVDAVFKEPSKYASSSIWLAVLGYAAQIYCDFSGYTDMAIGVAHAFGFKLPLNFNMPYMAANITEFWRRWHISLSSWLRDYLYVPLGGNRYGTWKTYRNLILTMLLGGLWHGANWTFVAWGLFHGILLALHRAVKLPAWTAHTICKPFFVLGTFFSVCIGWVFFRAQTFTDAAEVLNRMFVPSDGRILDRQTLVGVNGLLLLVLLCHLFGTFVNVRKLERWVPAPVLGGALAALLLLAQLLMPEDGKNFIYFQF